MPQDKLQNGNRTDEVLAQLFFWPGQHELANHLAGQLGGPPPLAFDPIGVTAALRSRKTVVVLWRGPDADLAACLINGAPVAPALDNWKDKARALAVLFRKNRRLMILAEGEALRTTGTEALAERLALPDAPTLPDAGSLPGLHHPSALGQALIHIALEQDEDLRLLLDEVVSSSLPVPDLAMGDVLTCAVAQSAKASQSLSALHQDLVEAKRLRHQLEANWADIKSREDQLRAQLDQMTAEASADKAAAEAEAAATAGAAALHIAALQDQLAQHQSQAATEAARLAEVEAEADMLRAQLDLNQSLLVEHANAAQAAAAAATAATMRISTLEGALAKQEKQAGALLSDTNAVSARLMQRDTEVQALRTEVDAHKSALTDQSNAAKTNAAAAAQRVGVLEQELAKQDKQTAALLAEAQTTNSVLAERDTEAKALRAEVDLHKSALTEQTAAAIAAAEAAASATGQRISTLEDQLAKQEKKSARLLVEGLSVSAKLAEREAHSGMQIMQLTLSHSALLAQINELQAAGHSSAAQVQALEDMLAQKKQAVADLKTRLTAADQQIVNLATALDLERKNLDQALTEWTKSDVLLAERDVALDLITKQMVVVQDGLAQQIAAAIAQSEAADGRIQTLEVQALSEALARANVEADARVLRDAVNQTEQVLADERTKHTAALAERAAEIDLLAAQVHVLQDGLAQIVTTSADHQLVEARALAAGTADAPAPRTDAWDKALAKALAASRSEAEQRAKLELELDAVKTRLHLRIQREADQGFNQKLFAQMTVEATASLDEIARLAAANGGAQETQGL